MSSFTDKYYEPAYVVEKLLPKNAKTGTVLLFNNGVKAVKTQYKQWRVSFMSYMGYREDVYF